MKWKGLLRAAAAAVASTSLGYALEAPAPAVAESPAGAQEAPGLETLHIKFEIMNFNYYDLTKQTCPEEMLTKKHPRHKKHKKQIKAADKADEQDVGPRSLLPKVPAKVPDVKVPDVKVPDVKVPPAPKLEAPSTKVDASKAMDDVHAHSDHIAKSVEKALKPKEAAPKLPWMKKKAEEKEKKEEKKEEEKAAKSFLQMQKDTCYAPQDLGETTSTECTSIQDVLRDAIKETVKGMIACLFEQSISGGPAPGPAPMALPAPVAVPPASLLPAAGPAASFLMSKPTKAAQPAPAPAPSPGPSAPQEPDVNIFVTFTQGRKVGAGMSTIVNIAFLDTPANGIDDVAVAKPFLEWASKGLLNHQLNHALEEITDIKPKIHKVKMTTEMIEQWNVEKCEKHIKGLVDTFSLHYTRAQVPMALYNECTTFMTKMSFSHDYVLDHMDTVRCKRATRKFEKKWNYGKNTEGKDFEGMCLAACEAKYGRNAPTCNVHEGDGLHGQPLL